MLQTRQSGILLHPSSLPSKSGIGDFGEEAFRFINMLHHAHQHLWQILPLCPVDSYGSPYQSISAFAGETLFISLSGLVDCGYLQQGDVDEAQHFEPTGTNYQLARTVKEPLFAKAFHAFCAMDENSDFIKFRKDEHHWLEDYALFKALSDYFIINGECTSWLDFPEDIKHRTPDAMKHWQEALAKEIQLEKFLQYEFHLQWQALKAYAHKNNVEIIGDMPLFISMHSADAWVNPELFQLDSDGIPTKIAGVPPDYFSPTGQLWGNPLYDWKKHKKTDYLWWKRRVKKALSTVDVLRIDHFRGFSAYWAVPYGAETAMLGKWEKGPSKAFFKALEKELGKLPFIAEDLGILTEDVIQLRQDVKLPGMRILQFAFGNDKNNLYLPHVYDRNTVVYTGTHDNNTTRGWYKTATEEEKDHYRRYLNASGENASWDLIRLAMASCANTVIIPLQDVLDLDENDRMNIPGEAGGNWNFSFGWDMWQEERRAGLAYFSDLFGRNQPPQE